MPKDDLLMHTRQLGIPFNVKQSLYLTPLHVLRSKFFVEKALLYSVDFQVMVSLAIEFCKFVKKLKFVTRSTGRSVFPNAISQEPDFP